MNYVLFVVTTIVAIVIGRWVVAERDTIRCYRDHIEAAARETSEQTEPND